MNIAVIPARGGSKRIPKKNIKEFFGKPIIAYSIEAAQQTELFDRIVVSTDDEEIAQVAKHYGAEVPFIRPKKLSDDYTGTTEVIGHAAQWFRDNGEKVDYVCCIYATAPFLKAEYIEKGYRILVEEHAPYVFSVTEYEFPIQRSVVLDKTGSIKPYFPEYIGHRSQDLEKVYHDAGQFYWGAADAFISGKSLYSGESLPVILPRYLVQDIDDEEDWIQAEGLYNLNISDFGKKLGNNFSSNRHSIQNSVE